jgi:hypothetical protein
MRNTVSQPAWKPEHGDKGLQAFCDHVRTFANAEEVVKAVVQTTDATATTIWSEVMPTSSTWRLNVEVQGYSTAGDSGFYWRHNRYERGSSGAANLIRTSTPVADDEDVAGWAIAFTLGADGTISLAVTGAAGATVNWVAFVRVLQAPVLA